ncbi:hypothetical protein PSHT_14589, partial [Puccinia striiformis]
LRSEFRFPRKECKSNSQQEAASNNTESINQTGTVEEEPNTEDESNACVYLCGNSLGLQNRRTAEMVLAELDSCSGSLCSFRRKKLEKYDRSRAAKSTEVACTGSLTTNLHILMTTFYRPTKERYKILCEANCFPSDLYAFTSQIEMHGLDPKEALISLTPRPREFTLRLEDIISAINWVQFYTGQAFPIKQITAAGHQQGCIVGWDLAHAIGNIPLELNDWQVDFAAWCSYKYLNAGPGAIAGLFVHENWTSDPTKLGGPHGRPRMSQCEEQDNLCTRIRRLVCDFFILLTPIILELSWRDERITSAFGRVNGIYRDVLTRSFKLCQSTIRVDYPDSLNEQQSSRARTVGFTIITPSIPAQRGSQLSLMFLPSGKGLVIKIARQLLELGIVADEREPDVIRFSPVPMYNSFEDCRKTVEALNSILETQNLTSAVSS